MDKALINTEDNNDLLQEKIFVEKKPKQQINKYYPYIITIFVIFSIYFLFFIFFGYIVLTPISVSGPSMQPTLNASAKGVQYDVNTDIVYIYRTQNVKKQDIIVFDPHSLSLSKDIINSLDENSYFIKRVIATAGDTIQFKANPDSYGNTYTMAFDLYINGEYQKEDYASEILMSVGYPTRSITSSSIPNIEIYNKLINEEIITVPDDCIFVMGDNRLHSTDSRKFGFVSVKSILGVVKIHVPYGTNMIYSIYHSIKEKYLF